MKLSHNEWVHNVLSVAVRDPVILVWPALCITTISFLQDIVLQLIEGIGVGPMFSFSHNRMQFLCQGILLVCIFEIICFKVIDSCNYILQVVNYFSHRKTVGPHVVHFKAQGVGKECYQPHRGVPG